MRKHEKKEIVFSRRTFEDQSPFNGLQLLEKSLSLFITLYDTIDLKGWTKEERWTSKFEFKFFLVFTSIALILITIYILF